MDFNNSSANMRQTEGPKLPQRVAMYCTGGIRCEKASSLLLSKGFKEVIILQPNVTLLAVFHSFRHLHSTPTEYICLICLCLSFVGHICSESLYNMSVLEFLSDTLFVMTKISSDVSFT